MVRQDSRWVHGDQRGNPKNLFNHQLFDTQIATLRVRGVPRQIIEALQSQRGAVLARASETEIGNGNTSFLPVIPRSLRSLYDLIAMVRCGPEEGYTCLNPVEITDVADVPEGGPHYIYDVDDGSSACGKSPEDVPKIFEQTNRSPLTVAGIIALAVHTNVLLKHNVWTPGSRYASTGGVLAICLDSGRRPRLLWGYLTHSSSRWMPPSCFCLPSS